MYNRVTRFLIGTSGANQGTSLPTIKAGDLLFINAKNQEVLTASTIATLSDNDAVYIAMGVKAGVPRLSSPIRRKEKEKFNREAFREAAQQVDEFTAVLEAGEHYKVLTVLKDEFRIIANRQTIMEVPDYEATGDPAVDGPKLASLITKYKGTYGVLKGEYDAVAQTVKIVAQEVPLEEIDDYQFVAFSTAFVKLEKGTSQSRSNGTPLEVTTTTKADGGSGVPAQLVRMERMAKGYLGDTDLRNHLDRAANPSYIDPAGEYDIIHVTHFDKHQGDHEFTMESPVQTTIVTPTGSAKSSYVETMLKAFFNKDAAATTTSQPDPDEDPA